MVAYIESVLGSNLTPIRPFNSCINTYETDRGEIVVCKELSDRDTKIYKVEFESSFLTLINKYKNGYFFIKYKTNIYFAMIPYVKMIIDTYLGHGENWYIDVREISNNKNIPMHLANYKNYESYTLHFNIFSNIFSIQNLNKTSIKEAILTITEKNITSDECKEALEYLKKNKNMVIDILSNNK